MASTSSSASNSQYCPRWKYDVFLSFRGEDTRETITGYLYERLTRRGIITFQDDKRLEHGDSISEELLKAMEDSQVALVVFSENYATSRWCLDELVKIMECTKVGNGKTVMPVFYGVDATDVRNQSKSFAEAFAKHESRYSDGEGMQKVQRWRTSLTAAANLKGYVFPDGVESDRVERIVDEISSKCKTSVSYLHEVVGIDTQLKKVESLLKMEINDVRIVWIWGMGGVGKTTLAKTIFYKLSSKFKDVCFLENIKENKHKMHSLQNTLLFKLFGEKENCVKDKEEGRSLLARRLPFKKVLIVLDDIDDRDQLDYLAKDLGWFGKGSRIIATTRDKHLRRENDVVFEVETLLDCDAIKLFNQYAFVKEVPECFKDLTLKIVHHAKGLPLALKVLGSSLHGMDKTEWVSALNRIKENPGSKINENLKISYDGLEPEEKEIFLDIACFFRGKRKKEVMQVLESCYEGSQIGLRVLVHKSLVFISEYETIEMHDLIQDMGRNIVKMQKHPGERSRLWNAGDFKEVMDGNTGTKAMEVIWLDDYVEKLSFSKKAMKNMKRLRILSISEFHTHDDSIEYLPNSLRWFECHRYPWKSLPEDFKPNRLVHLNLGGSSLQHLWIGTKHLPSLRFLHLDGSESLERTPDFTGMPNLECLDLEECRSLEEVHPSLKCCGKLIRLYLDGCFSLERFPYVNVESLEYLDLEYCSSLEKFPEFPGRMKPELEIWMAGSGIMEIPPSIFQHQAHLTTLDLSEMEDLVALPSSICKLKGLVKLIVSECLKLESLPEEIGDLENLEELHASYTLISRPPSSIMRLNKLKFLNLSDCKRLTQLPDFTGMPDLETLHLSNCINLEEVHHSLGFLEKLWKLELTNCKRLKRFPSLCINSLEYLNLKGCSSLENFPEILVSMILELRRGIRELNLRGLINLVTLPSSICKVKSLVVLNVSGCSKLQSLPEEIGDLENLEELYASGTLLSRALPSIVRLNKLKFLNLLDCKRLTQLPDFTGMPDLETLHLSNCINLEEVHHSLGFLKKLYKLELTNCKRLKRFPSLCIDSLEYLNLTGCSSIENFPEILGSMNLELRSGMEGSGIRELPSSIFQHQAHLTELHLDGMVNLVTLPSSICKLKGLVKLIVSECSKLESLPEEIGDLENLEELHASYTLISRPPSSIMRLNKLKFLRFVKQKSDGVCFVFPQVNEGLHSLEELNLSWCNLIDGGLPEDIGCLSTLKVLCLGGNNFEHLPRSIAQLGALRSLDLSDCKRLKQLPEFSEQLDTIEAEWSNDWICNSLFQNISSLQHASDSFSLRVFTSRWMNTPSWFHHRGVDRSVSVNLPENWYVYDKFLGFAVCYSYTLIDITAHLIPLCDDGMSSMTQKFALSSHSKVFPAIYFFLVPFAGLWDTSMANGKTPNDYGRITLSFSGVMKEFGFRLLYKDEPELCIEIRRSRYDDSEHHEEDSSIGIRRSRYGDSEHHEEDSSTGIRRSRYDDSEHHEEDSSIGIRRSRYDASEHHEEASCSSFKKQRSQVEVPVSSKNVAALSHKPRILD